MTDKLTLGFGGKYDVTILFREEPTVLTIEAESISHARRVIQRQLDELGEGGYVVKVERAKRP